MKLRSSAVFAAVFAMSASSAAIAQAAVPPLTQNYLAGSWYDNAQCKGTPFFVFDNAGNVTINEAPGSSAKANYSILGTEEVLLHSATGQFSVNIRPSNDRLLLMNDPTSGNSYEPGYRCQVPYPTAAAAPAPSVLPQAARSKPAPATPAGELEVWR